jgi:hypothetical protein
MDLIAKARQLESTIARSLDRVARDFVRPQRTEPLEIAHAVVEQVEGQIQPGGRGARVFPFTHVIVLVAAATRDARARFEAVFNSAPTLQERVAERLAAAGCRGAMPAVIVTYVPRPHKTWSEQAFHIRFSREPDAASPEAAADSDAPRIELTVIKGSAERRSYSFEARRIDIGRCRDVRDTRHHLIRANDIAFVEGADPANQSVSRQHAHIAYDSRTSAFRIYDDGSSHGTVVVRGGKTFPVPRGTRGLRLQAGDELALGDARLRVRIA